MRGPEFFVTTVFTLGPLDVSDSLLTAGGLTVALWLAFWGATRRLRREPAMVQVIAEAIVVAMESAVREVAPRDYQRIAPFVMALWLFILLANLVGLVPGLASPTRDLSVTAALAIVPSRYAEILPLAALEAMLQDAVNRFWGPSPMMFGPSDTDSPNSAELLRWRVKRKPKIREGLRVS